jgi:PII-like signaling protein
MKGFLVIFFTQQNRRHHGKMLGDWLVDLAKEMGLRGATLATGIEGFGHSGKLHSSHFFELADQPTEIRLAITEEEFARLFERLASEEISLFYIKTSIEFGAVGMRADPADRVG